MQSIITYLSLLFAGCILNAQNIVEVTINNFNNNDGTVKVGLYQNQTEWLEKEYMAKESTISNSVATITFTNVPDGIYGVSCFHDEDNDDEFDMYLGFFPAEDYGCSNGAAGRFGPPKWIDAKFELKNNETKQINISL